MNEHDRQEIARLVAAELQASGCGASTNCQVFDATTIQAIKDWAKAYRSLRKFAWWAGAIVTSTLLTAFASGAVWVVMKGLKAAFKE